MEKRALNFLILFLYVTGFKKKKKKKKKLRFPNVHSLSKIGRFAEQQQLSQTSELLASGLFGVGIGAGTGSLSFSFDNPASGGASILTTSLPTTGLSTSSLTYSSPTTAYTSAFVAAPSYSPPDTAKVNLMCYKGRK